MKNLPSRLTAKVYLVHDHPFVYATLTDLQPGMGMIQIHSDWGQYTAFWAAMGDRTVAEFVTQASSEYIQGCFRERLNYMGMKAVAKERAVYFMAHCWPRIREEILKDLKENP